MIVALYYGSGICFPFMYLLKIENSLKNPSAIENG